MAIIFHSDKVWTRIRQLLKHQKAGALVAVPFLAPNAAKQLPLRRGDVLVTRFDDAAIKGGLVDPKEVVKNIRHGVEVHSVENLHAKVYVFGNWAIAGSTNVSRSSEEQLIEAACETNDKTVIASCRRFLQGLRGEIVELDFAKSKLRLYQPPKFGVPRNATRKRPFHSDLIATKLHFVDLDPEDEQNEELGRAKAQKDIQDSNTFRVDSFRWTGNAPTIFPRGKRVLRCTEDKKGRVTVEAPAHILRIRRYKSRRGIQRVWVFVAARKRVRERSLRTVLSKIPAANSLRNLRSCRPIRDLDLALALTRLWPTL